METLDGKQAEKGLKRPKRSKNEAKKRSSAVWDQENSQVRILSPRPFDRLYRGKFPVTGGFLLFLRLFRGDFCFAFGNHLSQLILALFPRMRVYVEAFAHQRAPFR